MLTPGSSSNIHVRPVVTILKELLIIIVMKG